MSYSLTVGDLEPPMVLTASVNDAAQDLAEAETIQLLWLKPDGTETLVDLEDVDLATGQVQRVWEDGDTDMAGVHRGRIVVTWDGDPDPDRPQTFPNDGSWIIWWVYE